MISGREFVAALTRYRFDFFTGVPGSLVEVTPAEIRDRFRASLDASGL